MAESDYLSGEEPPEARWYPEGRKRRRQHFAHHASNTHWRDAQGKNWEIRKMTDGHLCNTIRMLGRRFHEVQVSNDFIGYDPDFARRGPSALFPVYQALHDEATRRGLRP